MTSSKKATIISFNREISILTRLLVSFLKSHNYNTRAYFHETMVCFHHRTKKYVSLKKAVTELKAKRL